MAPREFPKLINRDPVADRRADPRLRSEQTNAERYDANGENGCSGIDKRNRAARLTGGWREHGEKESR